MRLTARQPVETEASNGQRSMPELVHAIASDTSTLVRKEVELARQEFMEALTARIKAAGAMGAAAVAVLFALGFAAAAGARALDGVVSGWAARLIVAGGFLLIAAMAAVVGIARAKSPPMKPEKTVETVKEDVEWAKAQLKR
jgi:hypothetical protein